MSKDIMGREILFRGKRIDNGEWIKGDLITTPFIRNETQQNIIYILDVTKADYYCFEDLTEDNGYFEVDPSTVCQYIGLTDENGRKIFEGDIINDIDYGIMKCIYLHGSFVWYKEDAFKIECMRYVPVIEVIGNIFDNHELLEGGDSKWAG